LAAALTMAAVVISLGRSHETTTVQLIAAVVLRVVIGAVTHCSVLFSLWRLQGKPRGFEGKVLTIMELRAPVMRPIAQFLRGERARVG